MLPGEEEAKKKEVAELSAPPPKVMSTASLAASSQEDVGNASTNGGPPIYGGPRKQRAGVTSRYASAPTLSLSSAASGVGEGTSSVFSGLKPPTALNLVGKSSTLAPAVFKPAAMPVQAVEESVGEGTGPNAGAGGIQELGEDTATTLGGDATEQSGSGTARSLGGGTAVLPQIFPPSGTTAAHMEPQQNQELADSHNAAATEEYPAIYDTFGAAGEANGSGAYYTSYDQQHQDGYQDGTATGYQGDTFQVEGGYQGQIGVESGGDGVEGGDGGNLPAAVVNPVTLEILTFWAYYRKCGYEIDAMAEWVQQVRKKERNEVVLG